MVMMLLLLLLIVVMTMMMTMTLIATTIIYYYDDHTILEDEFHVDVEYEARVMNSIDQPPLTPPKR